MPWNLILLPLLGGFIFLSRCFFFRYRFQRYEGERLLLHCAWIGTILAAVARAAVALLATTGPGRTLMASLHGLVPAADFPYLGTALAAFILGFILAEVSNAALRIFSTRGAGKSYVLNHEDPDGLTVTLAENLFEGIPVSVTLVNRKVYVGYVWDLPKSPRDKYFSLMLLLSGYRDEDTLAFRESINYADKTELDQQMPKYFIITIAIKDVVTANPFDPEEYRLTFDRRLTER